MASAVSPAPPSLHERMYRSLYLIRRAEEEVARIYPTDKIKSPVHLSIGQEAIAVGACEALEPGDIVFATYRSHAAYLAKTHDLKGFMAELYGKATGCTRGKGGSMHLANVPLGMMGTSAVVGTTIPQAVGYAYALKYRRSKSVVVCFLGDGAVEEGVFHESLNFAGLKELPLIFVCENNSYAIHTRQDQRQSWKSIGDVVRGHGIPAETIQNNDALSLHARVRDIGAEMRDRKRGPAFVECMTCRWKEHVGPHEDFALGYRSEADVRPWKEQDTVRVVGEMLPQERRSLIEQEVELELQQAIEFADESPFPDTSELNSNVYGPPSASSETVHPDLGERTIGFVEAIREATEMEMSRDDSVLVFGLDVDDPKAILGTTRILPQKFGRERVFGTPLSEDAMTGAAIGMALAGLRPVHVHIRMDFLMLAMNQLVNIAAKTRYMYAGQAHVPLVVRSLIGRSWGQGAQHSQALHSFFMHVPGLKVIAPSTPYDAKGGLIAAIQDDDPVLFVEHRLVHYQKGPVPEESYTLPPGKARITVEGEHVTLVGISYMQIECLRAQRYLEAEGILAEVIDPIWLSPLDTQTIVDSVRKTRRLVVVDNGWTTCGASAEIAACVAQALEGEADVRIRRLGFAPVTCPTTPALEDHFYPNPRDIASMAYGLVKDDQGGWMPDERDDLQAIEFKGPF